MRILHVITRLILGGAQQSTVLSCAQQVAAGHRVWLVYGPVYGPEGSLMEDAARSGAELVRIRGLRRAVLPVHDGRSYLALRWLMAQVRPDIVHTHSSKAGIVGRAAAWHQRVPGVVHTIHGLPFHDGQRCVERRAYIAAERWAGRHCHRLVGITRAMCDAFCEHGIGRPGQFAVVPSGVDTERFERPRQLVSPDAIRRRHNIGPDAKIIGLVARLDRFKGHEDLLDMLPVLQRRWADVHLLFVGDGYHRTAVEQRIQEHGRQGHVTITGLTSLEQMPSYYHAMDMMVLPSYQEGQGRVLIEALLCDCPIAGYDTGGIGEVCIDGRTGRLAPTGDKRALTAAIDQMFENPEQTKRMTAIGSEHMRRNFSANAMAHRLEQLYEQTLKRPQAPGPHP